VRFRITPHSTFKPPADALELLWMRLGPSRDEMSFAKVGAEIKVSLGDDAPVAMTRDERVDIGRRAVLAIVLDVCDGSPELKSDWFAVGFEG
jgi:hypothetical protein